MSKQRSMKWTKADRGIVMSEEKKANGASGAQCKQHTGAAKTAALSRGIVVAGAQGAHLNFAEADLVVDLAGLTRKAFNAGGAAVLSGTKWLVEALAPSVTHPDTVFIDWPDMGIPTVGVRFWRELFKLTPDNARVVFACMGGHGRTGTGIACYIAASLESQGGKAVPDAADLIRLVRAQHCGCAIEADSQEDYIARVVSEMRAPGDRDELARQYEGIDRARSERAKSRAHAKSGGAQKVLEVAMQVTNPATTTTEPQPAVEGEAAPAVEDDAAPQETVQVSAFLNALGGNAVPVRQKLFRDGAGSVVSASGEVLMARSSMTDKTYKWVKGTLFTWGEMLEKKALGAGGGN